MSTRTKNAKILISGDTRTFRQEVDKAGQSTAGFRKQAGGAIEQLAQAVGINTRAISSSIDTAAKTTGSLSTAFKGAAAGSGILTGALKLLKVALISTGIGAIVVALGSLVSYFTKTQRGADKVKQVMSGFKAVINVLIDRLSSFGEGLFLIFTGKFKQGWDALKGSMKGVGDEIKEEAKAATDLEKRTQALRDREIELIEVQARRRKEIARLRLDEKDASKSTEDRLKALQGAIALEKVALNEEMELQKERIKIMEEQVGLGESLAEDYRMLAEEKAKLQEIEERSLNFNRKLAERTNTLTRELEANAKAIRDQTAAMYEGLKPLQGNTEAQGIDPKKLVPVEEVQSRVVTLNESLATIGQVMIDLNGVFESAIQNMTVGIGEWIGAMAAGQAGSDGFKTLIAGTFADLAITVGKIAISAGLAVAGIKNALMTLNWALAVGAGVALVALGTAVKSKLSSAATGGGGSASVGLSSMSGGGSNRGAFSTGSRGSFGTEPQPLVIRLEGELKAKGSDLAYTLNREVSRKRIST